MRGVMVCVFAATVVVAFSSAGCSHRSKEHKKEPLAITTTSLPVATEGASYSVTIKATGGTTPYTWTVSGLPSGLTWTQVGNTVEISGTPDVGTAGIYGVDVTVTDSSSPAQNVSVTLQLVVNPAGGATGDWYVDALNGSDTNSGTSWSDAFATIGKALSVATDGDTILVADATYNETDLNFNGKKIHLKGVDHHSGGLTQPVIDCGGNGRAFIFDSGETDDSVVDNFVIQNGSAQCGGAIYCTNSSSPTIRNCIFNSNHAQDYGGAIYCWDSSPTVTNCTFSGNSANGVQAGGGAIACESNSSPTISGCTFSGNNTNYFGGAIFCENSSSPSIINCTFSGNSAASYHGGAIACNSSSPTITGCTFTGNSANRYGGAVCCWDSSSPSIVNCIFSGNSAYFAGGAVVCLSSNLTATNCTFSGNSAPGNLGGGGAIECEQSSITFNNCILWGNTIASNGGGREIWAVASTVTLNHCCVDNSAGAYTNWNSTIDDSNNCIHQDPLFVDAANGDYHLQPTSPCIDAGDNSYVPSGVTTDLDGNPRIANGTVDIGAYEKQ